MNVISGAARPALSTLEQRDDFVRRHVGPSEAEIGAIDRLGLGQPALIPE